MTDTTSTRPQMGDETLSDVKLLQMASDVWIGMARPVTRQSDRWATVLEQHRWLGPFAVALLRAAMSRVRASLPQHAQSSWRDQILPGTLEAFTARMKHILDNYGSKIGLTDAQSAELASLITKDAEWLMRAAHFFEPQRAQSGVVEETPYHMANLVDALAQVKDTGDWWGEILNNIVAAMKSLGLSELRANSGRVFTIEQIDTRNIRALATPQPDRESEGEDIDTLDAMEAHEHWGVSVDTHGDDIVRIETAMLAGKADLSEQDLATIRTAARHLLSFAGAPMIIPRPTTHKGER